MDDVDAALRTGEPLPLLGLVSSLLAAVHPRLREPLLDPTDLQPPPFDLLVQSFFDAPMPETSAALAAMAGLLGDDLLRRRARREIADRGHPLPPWLADLDQARHEGEVVQMSHVLGDGDNLLVGVRFADGREATAVVYVDHNMGTLVKDAFVLPEPVGEVVETFRLAADDPDVSFIHLAAADARARITDAIEAWTRYPAALESETWPACRPFVEWVVGMLPPGGTPSPAWSNDNLRTLADRVVASPFGSGLADADLRNLLTAILDLIAGSGGDPLRWSPVAVKVLLLDRLPRAAVADPRSLGQAPRVLRALIRFSHAERGIRPELTAETLAAVDAFEPRYLAAIRVRGQRSPEERLGQDFPDAALASLIEHQLGVLYRAVGGPQALAELDAEPLPDEPFDWSAVPADVHEPVAEVLAGTERCCTELFDTELRTAARRLLARAAESRPAIFRGRVRPETSAAAVCWIVAKANGIFDEGEISVQELMRCCGSGATPSTRAKAFLAAIGVDATDYAYVSCLGSGDYLTARRRARFIAERDRLLP